MNRTIFLIDPSNYNCADLILSTHIKRIQYNRHHYIYNVFSCYSTLFVTLYQIQLVN